MYVITNQHYCDNHDCNPPDKCNCMLNVYSYCVFYNIV